MTAVRNGKPLCPEAEYRASLTDDEFWAHVYPQPIEDWSWLPGFEPWGEMDDADLLIGVANPCPVCGTTYACGYDDQGRPFVHIEDNR